MDKIHNYTVVIPMACRYFYSDVPRLCFAAMFVKGQAKAMDYFTCRQCGFNCKAQFTIGRKGLCYVVSPSH